MNAPAPAAPVSVPPRPRVGGVVVPHQPTRLQRVIAWLVVAAIRLVAATLRRRPATELRVPDEPVIFALWHNRLAVCVPACRKFLRPLRGRDTLAALISASRDGALLAAIVEEFGVHPVRGSSSRRGGQALKELVSWMRQGNDVALTPDGPRGPCYQAREGALVLAQLTGAPILPIACRVRGKLRLKSWDRFQVPLPFATYELALLPAIRVPREATPEERERLRQQLEAALREGTQGD